DPRMTDWQHLPAVVSVTGHSLGAGVSAIAMMALRAHGFSIGESFNYGMPRTGDLAFSTAFSDSFTGSFWRVTHGKDPIVHMPPRAWTPWNWRHVEPEVFYPGDLDDGFKICNVGTDEKCSFQFGDLNYVIADHMKYLGIDMGQKGCAGVNLTILI
ncbi:unnamed protein product, partial [Polarella glacialis]